MAAENEPFVTWAIYQGPDDYPEGYVVRKWYIGPGDARPGEAWRAATLEEARSHLPAGATKLPTGDPDPHIIETWA